MVTSIFSFSYNDFFTLPKANCSSQLHLFLLTWIAVNLHQPKSLSCTKESKLAVSVLRGSQIVFPFHNPNYYNFHDILNIQWSLRTKSKTTINRLTTNHRKLIPLQMIWAKTSIQSIRPYFEPQAVPGSLCPYARDLDTVPRGDNGVDICPWIVQTMAY